MSSVPTCKTHGKQYLIWSVEEKKSPHFLRVTCSAFSGKFVAWAWREEGEVKLNEMQQTAVKTLSRQ